MSYLKNPIKFMFAYGMNTNLTSMLLRCSKAKVIGNAYLPDYKLSFRYHLDVEPSKYDIVEGVLWELTDEDFEVIDQVEGYPEYYTRYIMQPYLRHYRNVFPAWTYVMKDKGSLQLPDNRYFNLVAEGYEQNGIKTEQLYDALDRITHRETVI